jgi:hypothetical protein
VKQIIPRGVALRRSLTVIVAATGLTVAGCANNPANAPSAQSTMPSPPVLSSTPSGQPQVAILAWARSFCQALQPAFGELGAPSQLDFRNPDATRQSFVNYLSNARNATQQAIDRLSSVGPPPVENGLQIFIQVRTDLIALRDNLSKAVAQLKPANPNDSGAIGRALGAASNLVGVFGTLVRDPQLRAAIDQAPECHHLSAGNSAAQTSQPPG